MLWQGGQGSKFSKFSKLPLPGYFAEQKLRGLLLLNIIVLNNSKHIFNMLLLLTLQLIASKWQ